MDDWSKESNCPLKHSSPEKAELLKLIKLFKVLPAVSQWITYIPDSGGFAHEQQTSLCPLQVNTTISFLTWLSFSAAYFQDKFKSLRFLEVILHVAILAQTGL